MILRSVVFTLGFAFGAVAQAVAQLATPAPTPQIPPTSSSAPSPTATPVPTPTLAPTAAPSVSATPVPQSPYKYVVDPTPNPSATPGAPQIIRIEVNDRTVHPGGQVAVRVTTTPNVDNVIITAEGHDIAVPKAQDGLFAGITTLPWFIPPWMLKTYQVTFTAATVDGKRVATTIPITLSR